MTSAAPTLPDSIALAQAGHKTEAYHLLKMLAQSRNTDTNVLLWLAFTTPDLDEAERVITAIGVIEPGNANLAAAQHWLLQERQKRAASTTPPVPPFAAAATTPAQQPQPTTAPTKRTSAGNSSALLPTTPRAPHSPKRLARMAYRPKGIAETRELFAICAVVLAMLIAVLPSLVFSIGIAALIGIVIAAALRLGIGRRAGESLAWGILELVVIAACIFGPICGIFWLFMNMAQNDPHFLVPNFQFPTPTAHPVR